MAEIDDDAARVLTFLAARGPLDVARATPAEVRAFYAGFPVAPGPQVHEMREIEVAGADGLLAARLYRPSAAQDLPVLVWFHGGGMVLGDLDSGDWACRELCVQAGTLVVNVAYRLAPEHKFPAAPHDAFAALQWVAANAAALGGDSLRISVGGDSAGGTLAAVCCLQAKAQGGPAIRSQLLVYPGVDRDLERASVHEFARGPILTRDSMLWFRGHYHTHEDELLDWRATPALAPNHGGLPPACVLTAEIDPIRDAGEAYANALSHAGVMTTMKRYNGVYHGFFTMGPSIGKCALAVSEAAGFLRRI